MNVSNTQLRRIADCRRFFVFRHTRDIPAVHDDITPLDIVLAGCYIISRIASTDVIRNSRVGTTTLNRCMCSVAARLVSQREPTCWLFVLYARAAVHPTDAAIVTTTGKCERADAESRFGGIPSSTE